MKRKDIFAAAFCFCCCLLASCASSSLGVFGGRSSAANSAFTNSEAIAALKDALAEGAVSAATSLSATNGYFSDAALKIMLPPEAGTLLEYLDKIPGGQKLVEDVVLRLNRSAESAAQEVAPIFQNAITSMSVRDGVAIVCGESDAATAYLRQKTYDKLLKLYKPKVSAALSAPLVLGISAETAWTSLMTKYGEIAKPVNTVAKLTGKAEPMPEISVDLAAYATEKALDGLFAKVGEEELKVRENPKAYASGMIQKVFGAVKAGAKK